MNQSNMAIAKAFYTAMGEKKILELEKYLHPQIQFNAPLAKLKGKEAYLEAAKNFAAFFKMLTIRATFGEGDQAMVVYDLDFPAPIGSSSAAALMSLSAGLITKIELFYDARPLEK
jgi:hypothetical protein